MNTDVLPDDAGGTGSRPAGGDVVLQVGPHGGYAVARTGPATEAAGLAPRLFWKSASCARAISIAWVMTWVRSVLPPRYFAYCSTARTSCAGSRRLTSLELDRGLGLDRESVHRASFPEAFGFGWLAEEGARCVPCRGRDGPGRVKARKGYGRAAGGAGPGGFSGMRRRRRRLSDSKSPGSAGRLAFGRLELQVPHGDPHTRPSPSHST